MCPPDDILLLQNEVDEINVWANKLKSNFEISDFIYDEGNVYEQPMVKEIQGMLWKGKADIVHKDFVIDLKTTADQDKFKWSAYNYNYDSQAYIYQQLFGKQMVFITICKKSLRLKKWYTTPEFIASGEEKVSRAIEVYNRFFSDQSTEDINNFVEVEDL